MIKPGDLCKFLDVNDDPEIIFIISIVISDHLKQPIRKQVPGYDVKVLINSLIVKYHLSTSDPNTLFYNDYHANLNVPYILYEITPL